MKGSFMSPTVSSQNRILIGALLATFSLFFSGLVHAQEQDALPDYITAEYGTPPAIPDGPLSADVETAVRVAFIDSVAQSAWGSDHDLPNEEGEGRWS